MSKNVIKRLINAFDLLLIFIYPIIPTQPPPLTIANLYMYVNQSLWHEV